MRTELECDPLEFISRHVLSSVPKKDPQQHLALQERGHFLGAIKYAGDGNQSPAFSTPPPYFLQHCYLVSAINNVFLEGAVALPRPKQGGIEGAEGRQARFRRVLPRPLIDDILSPERGIVAHPSSDPSPRRFARERP